MPPLGVVIAPGRHRPARPHFTRRGHALLIVYSPGSASSDQQAPTLRTDKYGFWAEGFRRLPSTAVSDQLTRPLISGFGVRVPDGAPSTTAAPPHGRGRCIVSGPGPHCLAGPVTAVPPPGGGLAGCQAVELH